MHKIKRTYIVLMLSSRNFMSEVGLSRALVCWYRYVLLAEPPPLARKRKL
jgi:hypothetical protein